MKLSEVLGTDWLATKLWRPRITVGEAGDVLFLDDGRRGIAIVDRRRVPLYKRGIRKRLANLAEWYGLDRMPLGAGDLVVNCGANIGEVAIILAERGCKVIAVEPDPAALVCLRYNVARLHDVVSVEPVGLWNRNDTLTFFQKSDTADTSAINREGKPFDVNVRTLDSYGIGRVALLVGDAEGAEPEVFAGARETLRRTRHVSFDCGPERQGKSTAAECAAILQGLGFTTEISREGRLFGHNARA